MIRGKTLAVFAIAVLGMPCAVPAQTTAGVVDLRAGGLISIQPKGYDGTGGPYLDNSLEGIVAGASIAVQIAPHRRPLIAVELSTTTALTALQRGRFIVGDGPADLRQPIEARHRDTLLSFLAGFRAGRRAAAEVKGGVTLLFGTPHREAHEFDDPGGQIGWTGGFDARAPITDRIAITPGFRYTYALRGADGFYFGLGKHIVRAGVGVAIALAH